MHWESCLRSVARRNPWGLHQGLCPAAQQRLLLTDHQHPADCLTSQQQLPNLPMAQPRRGAKGAVGEGGSAARNRAWSRDTGEVWRALQQGCRGLCQGAEVLQRGSGVSVGAGARSASVGVPEGCPGGTRGVRPVAGLSPASRRRRPATSAGTAGAAGPRGRPRRCRRPGRWRAGPGRTGGGTTASRRRVGRGRRRREALAAPLRLGSGVGDLLAARRLYKPFS